MWYYNNVRGQGKTNNKQGGIKMNYYKKLHDGVNGVMHHEPEKITYKEALGLLLGCYKDNDMTRDMLTLDNIIMRRELRGLYETDA